MGGNLRALALILGAIGVLALVAEAFSGHHGAVFGSEAGIGFLGAAAFILAAYGLGLVLKRGEGFHDR